MNSEIKRNIMEVNPINLPSWMSSKAVFQQGVPFVIEGTAAASATITLEVVKDPTDGRRVSKLDTEYGVILSLETTTSPKGKFKFNIPSYKASTDTYTFVFKCFSNTVTINDIRCGDVWVFLGSELISIPINKSNAPATPLKRQVMSLIRFFTPTRSGLESNEKVISYEPKNKFSDTSWIKVTDTKELADVSSAVFSFAYSLADQIHYPVGIVDLSKEDSTILNWLSHDVVEKNEAVSDYLKGLNLYFDSEGYDDLLQMDAQRLEANRLRQEIKEGKQRFDFDFAKESRLAELEGKDEAGKPLIGDDLVEVDTDKIIDNQDIDFPNTSHKSAKDGAGDASKTNKSQAAAALKSNAAMTLSGSVNAEIKFKKKNAKTDIGFIKEKFRLSLLYNAKLAPLDKLPIRGMCYSPNRDETVFERYDLLLMALLQTLIGVFEPKSVTDDKVMPSLLFTQMHPDCVNFDNPYRVLEFNEDLGAFARRLTMPTGIVSCHDLLLPDKTKSYTLGVRLSVVALGIHFTPKMPKSCPECVGAERAGNKMILSFDNLADGLRLSENESVLRGFSVCGSDRVFYPAEARILHGVRVMVWRDDIAEPVSVCYGFTPFPHESTFKNLTDLPVLPFRFDRESAFYSPDLSFAHCDRLEFVGKEKEDSIFEKLKVYRNFKGNGVITADTMNKTEGSASLYIKYETENSLYGFEPVLSYASLMGPIELPRRNTVIIDVFNPEQKKKKLRIEGFEGEADIRQQLNWQTLTLHYAGEGNIILDKFRIIIEDNSRNGEIYIDNIRFK